MKRVLNISILLISIFMCCTIGYATDNPNSDGYYDFEFRTSRLGQYKIELTATETPFYETLPLDKVPSLYDKFPTSTWTGYTEVDNTEPSARYGTPIPKIKVDVAFATGAMGDQMDAFQNSIAELEAKLRDSRNNLDVKIQYIETVTIDLSSQDPSKILSTWESWKQYPTDPTTTWSFIPEDNSIQDNQYHCHRQGFIDREHDTSGDFELSADIVGYSHSYNDFYGLTFRHGLKGRHYAVVWQDIAGSRCGMYSGQLTTGVTLIKAGDFRSDGYADNGVALATYDACGSWAKGSYWNLKVKMIGNLIEIYLNDKLIISYTDNDPYLDGNYGIVSVSHGSGRFKNISITTGGTKTLVQATTDVNWRDDAHRFIIHSTDEVPQELQPGHDSEFTELISYLNSGNIFLFNLGIDAVNKDEFNTLDEALIDAQGNPRSKYLRNYPIKERMLQAAQEIIDMLKQFQTESEWILVDSDINWRVVEWADFEQDVPLNFGEHDGTGRYGDIDKQVSLDWGVSLTHLWTQPKILAERWRFRHFEDYFDNNLGKVNYNGAWIENAPTSFSKTGKYRINYQRKDNPFHTDVSLSNVFDMYRKWSTNYNDN